MALLDAHLEQMSLCAASIAELPYACSHADPSASTNRRNTIFHPNGAGSSIAGGGANAVRAPRRNTAVAAVLGNDLVERIRRGGGGGAGSGLGYRTYDGNNKNEVDVESLLEGAEKLLGVYPIPGAKDKIAAMRQRHAQVTASIDYYESRLAEQTTQLSRLNRNRDYMDEDDDIAEEVPEAPPLSEEDLRREEEEMRQLERKKRELEDRKELRANAHTFAKNVLSTAPSLYDGLATQTKRFQSTLPIYQAAVKAGLIRGQIPVPLGGTSGGMVDAAIVVEEFHAVELSTAITILGTGLGLLPLIIFGNEEQHEKFFKPFLNQDGEMLAGFAHSEPNGTANWLEKGAPGLQTTAYQDGGDWVINGDKLWTTNSGGWDQRGAHLQYIDKNDPAAYQVLSDPELGGHRSVNGPHSRFTDLRVPHANLLTPPEQGAQVVARTFGMSAAMVGAMSGGVMRHAFEFALSFCKTDARGGTLPIIQYSRVSDRLIDVKMKIEAARALTWKAMSVLESKECISWEQQLEIALEAKVWCSEQVVGVVETCMGVVGMRSYASDMPFTKLLSDAACLPLFGGGNIGVRRRQLEAILQRDNYSPWAATYG
ncbi:acyl-CoA dehydrogenase NM domain-like protein [Setomelanomma holmii]|uniref:DASH complex subunit SPC34 n=1 Tax=Setomelanomma holmii TaxID=210430 RepID=A0A9P4H5B9_9PLEO|nr:acyl-CoA dehydrogenase NM domain-like protein [Setomelanomma holmii]